MSKKIIIIIIIIALISVVGAYFYNNKNTPRTETGDSGIVSKIFSPFGLGKSNTADQNPGTYIAPGSKTPDTGVLFNSKFKQITNFSVSGATFLIDQRPLPAKAVEIDPKTGLPTATTDNSASSVKQLTKNTKQKTAPAPVVPTTEPVPAIRYMQKNNGHIYEMYLDTGASGQISNSTIPEVYDGLFGQNTNNVIYRLLGEDKKTIKTAYGVLGAKDSGFLPDNVEDVSIAPNGNTFFYLTPYSDGVIGSIGSFNDTRKTQVLNSAFTEWLTQWATNQKIFLTTKASWNSDGYLYSISLSNNKFVKVMGGVKGLTTLVNNAGDKVLYSSSTESGPKMGIYTISNATYTPTSVYGLPEKCVWSLDGSTIYCAVPTAFDGNNYPDKWYQGVDSFNDKFIRINTDTGTTSNIISSVNEIPADATKLFLDDKEQTLFFINKKDNTLWSLDLR